MTNRFYRALLAGAVSSMLVFGMASPAFAAVDPKDQWGLIPDDYVIVIPPSHNETIYVTPDTSASQKSSSHSSSNNSDKEQEADISEYSQRVLDLVNEEREKEGLTAFQVNDDLMNAAGIRAVELEISYSHTRPNGEKSSTIYQENGLTKPSSYAENIAFGQNSPESVVKAWLDSPGHYAKIVSEKYNIIGIGVYITKNGKLTWVLHFGN